MDRKDRVAQARPVLQPSKLFAAGRPAMSNGVSACDRLRPLAKPFAAPASELPAAVNKLMLDEHRHDDKQQQTLVATSSKTPSPPKPSLALDTVKRLLPLQKPSTERDQQKKLNDHGNSLFKRPTQLSSVTSTNEKSTGDASAVKRIQACSNRLFLTPASSTRGIFATTDEFRSDAETPGGGHSSSGFKNLDSGFLQKLRAFKTTTLPVYDDNDDDEDENYEDLEHENNDKKPQCDQQRDDRNGAANTAPTYSSHAKENEPPGVVNHATVETKPSLCTTAQQSYKSLIDKYLAKGSSKCDSNKQQDSNSRPPSVQACPPERKMQKSKSEADISKESSFKQQQRNQKSKRRSKSKDCSRSHNGSNAGSKESLAHSRASSSSSINSNKGSSSRDPKYKRIKVKGKAYDLFGQIGSGGSATVYEVREVATKRTYAVKVVDLSKADESTRLGYENEIQILKKLSQCKRVVRLIDYERVKNSSGEIKQLVLVLERGEADLSNVLKNFWKETADFLIDPHTIKHYWKEMLKAVDEIHSLGIVHSDLKPVNFITVLGKLKLIDFGIANAILPDCTSVIKDTMVGTINYMAPEALDNRSDLCPVGEKNKTYTKFNQKADIWSLGCILYNLVYGQAPFAAHQNLMSKMRAICNPRHAISFPPFHDPHAIDCMKKCLTRDPRLRPTAKELLEHPYLNMNHVVNSMYSEISNLTPRRLQSVSKLLESLSRKSTNDN